MKKEIAIVTGGSSGLGLSIAKLLLKNNIKVCLVARNEDKLDKVYNSLLKDFDNSLVFKFCADVANEDSVNGLYKMLKDNDFDIRYLFNVAGTGKRLKCDEASVVVINEVFSGSLVGLINMCTKGIKYIKDSDNKATIINVMSSAALKGNAMESLYCAAKWGARGYTESLRVELKGSNIQIIGVYPGGMKTNFWNKNVGEIPDTSGFMDSDEVADQIVYSVIDKNTILVTDIMISRI